MRGIDGEAAGMHVQPAPLALLQALDALLSDSAETSEEVQP